MKPKRTSTNAQYDPQVDDVCIMDKPGGGTFVVTKVVHNDHGAIYCDSTSPFVAARVMTMREWIELVGHHRTGEQHAEMLAEEQAYLRRHNT